MIDIRRIARHALLLDDPLGDGPGERCPLVIYGEKDEAPIHIGPAVCTIGAFDGIHEGHRFLIHSMIEDAHRRGLPSVIITFDVDPDEYFRPIESVRKVLDNETRIDMLRRIGADLVLVVPFSKEIAALTHERFFADIIGTIFDPAAVHVGHDFKLGAAGQGTMDVLIPWGEKNGVIMVPYDLVCARGLPISSTRIRTLVEGGHLERARELLGRSHFSRGTVVRGRGDGRKLGFPTANLKSEYPYLLPGDGVYACIVRIGDTFYPSATSVGAPITFPGVIQSAPVEAFALGFEGDLYGQELDIVYFQKLRGMEKYASRELLTEAVMKNIAEVADLMGDTGVEV